MTLATCLTQHFQRGKRRVVDGGVQVALVASSAFGKRQLRRVFTRHQ